MMSYWRLVCFILALVFTVAAANGLLNDAGILVILPAIFAIILVVIGLIKAKD